jgi:hypothetical protein
LDSKCSILPLAVFYTSGKLTSYHVNTNISHQRPCGLSYEKEENTTQPFSQPPITPVCDTSQRYKQHLSVCDYLIEIRPSCPLADPISNAQEILVDVPLPTINCFDAWYSTNMVTDICLECSILRNGNRIEICITCDKVLSNDWTIFITEISNAFFNTQTYVTKPTNAHV